MITSLDFYNDDFQDIYNEIQKPIYSFEKSDIIYFVDKREEY